MGLVGNFSRKMETTFKKANEGRPLEFPPSLFGTFVLSLYYHSINPALLPNKKKGK